MLGDVVKLDDPMKGAFSAVRGVEGEPSGPILKPFWADSCDSWIPWGSMVGMSFFSFQFCWGAFWGSTAAPGATWRSAAEGASSGRNVRPFSVFHHVPSLSLRVLFFGSSRFTDSPFDLDTFFCDFRPLASAHHWSLQRRRNLMSNHNMFTRFTRFQVMPGALAEDAAWKLRETSSRDLKGN